MPTPGLVDGPVTIPAEAEALRPGIRGFLAEWLRDMPAEQRARSWMGYDADFSRELGRRGYIGMTMPKAYGGQGLSAFARYVVVEELLAVGAPVVAHWIADRQSAPCILRFGTEAQRQAFIPAICRGELFFCIGMSEPNAGSDLASVTTRAVRTEGGWRLNGRKIWTTNAHRSHYMLALVRTSGEAGDRQRGLSQVVIDLSLPGIEIRPIRDIAGDAHFSEVVFEDVLLPPDALIGKEGEGWAQVNAELAFERSGPERFLSSMVLLDEWVGDLRARPVETSACELLGRAVSQLAVFRQMSIGVTALLEAGQSPLNEAAIIKDLGTTFEQMLPEAISTAIGRDPRAGHPASLMRVLDYTARMAPSFSLRGGTREIMRGMIARNAGLR
jgi:alkylation response protein AidB-like acyl-CoA dehydrogenase